MRYRPLLVLHVTFQLGMRQRRDPWRNLRIARGSSETPLPGQRLDKEFWRLRWATESQWLTDDQKVGCSCSARFTSLQLRPVSHFVVCSCPTLRKRHFVRVSLTPQLCAC